MRFAIDNGMIDMSSVQEAMKIEERNHYLSLHSREIWEGSNGRWYTYLPDETKKRGERLIAKSSEEKLKDVIIDFYKKLTEEKVMTFKKMFSHWVEVQRSEVSQNTIAKYENDYRRCVKDTDFENLPISGINTEMIRVFIGNRVRELGLPQRAYTNLVGYFNGVFNSALENEYITRNPMETYVVKKQFKNCKKSSKTKEDKTVSKTELECIFKVIDEKLQKNPTNMPLYAILLAAFTGMRVGELSALAWKDIYEEDGYIYVCQAEIRIREKGKPSVFEIASTKNDKAREIPMTAEIKNLLHYIRKIQKEIGIEAEYVFENQSGRSHTTAIADCAGAVSKKAGIKNKSIHCNRKTLSSMLHSLKSLSNLEVSSILGHGVEVNAKHYTFDLEGMQPKQDALSKANKSVVDLADYKENSVLKSVINNISKSGVM